MAEQKKDEKEVKGPRFEVRTPATGFRGERAGLKFYDGVATTDDEEKAKACAECGYQVKDLSRDKVLCNPLAGAKK